MLLILDDDESRMGMSNRSRARSRGVLIRIEDRIAVASASLDPADQARLGRKPRRVIDDLGLTRSGSDGSRPALRHGRAQGRFDKGPGALDGRGDCHEG